MIPHPPALPLPPARLTHSPPLPGPGALRAATRNAKHIAAHPPRGTPSLSRQMRRRLAIHEAKALAARKAGFRRSDWRLALSPELWRAV